jgi:hypothetical protein
MGCCYGTPAVHSSELQPLILWNLVYTPTRPAPSCTTQAEQNRQPGTRGTGAVGGTVSAPEVDSDIRATLTSAEPLGDNSSAHFHQRGATTGVAPQSRNAVAGPGSRLPPDGVRSVTTLPSPPAERDVSAPVVPPTGGVSPGLPVMGSVQFEPGRGPPTHVPELIRLQYREVTPEDYDLLCLLDASLPKQDTARKDSAVSGLQFVVAKECEASACQVCLCEFAPYSHVARLPCQHVFHMECITQWVTKGTGKCPLCREPIRCFMPGDTTVVGLAV